MNKYLFIRPFIIITFGCFLIALGWTAFLIPSQIIGGGISGAATLIYYSIGIPVGVTYMGVSVILIGVAMKVLGTGFGVKTIFGVIALSTLLAALQYFIRTPFVKDAFMATIIGGILNGVGVGTVFTQGGSTGGVDIIATMINKFRNISVGKAILVMDIFIITSSYFVFGSLEKIIYGYVVMAITSYTIDLVIEGAKESLQLFIISKNIDLIADRITRETPRGVTLLEGRGWYTKEERPVAMVIVRKYNLNSVLKIVHDSDNAAFVSITSINDVYGQGFESIRY